MVLVCHEANDIFMEAAKMARYAKKETLTTVMFVGEPCLRVGAGAAELGSSRSIRLRGAAGRALRCPRDALALLALQCSR